MKPTIGRIVIYKTRVNEITVALGSPETKEFPGIITRVNEDGTVNIFVFPDLHATTFSHCKGNVTEGSEPGQWHWPVLQK